MSTCTQLPDLIVKGPEGEAAAMKMMLLDRRFRNAAYAMHRKYPKIHAIVDWEDILYDAVVRFVGMVLRGKKLEYDCLVYFIKICNNICLEYLRRQRPPDFGLFDLFDIPKDLAPAVTPSMAELLMQYFSRLNEKCQTLLEARFLWDPQEKDKNELSQLIDGRVKPSAIPATMGRCKDDLRKIVGDNLEDLLNA